MPKPYYTTGKGKAEYAIRRRAHNWITIDGIQTETGLPRRAIRDAINGLVVNNILVRSGEFKNGTQYRYTDWELDRRNKAERT